MQGASEQNDVELDIDPEGADDIETEQNEGSDLVKPWDPKKIRITTKNFSLREVFTQIEDGEVDLAPDFQRSFVWDERKQTRLIESVLLGIPLPAFYFDQDLLGAIQVVDGVQRLTTVKLFMSNQLILKGMHLEYLKDLEGSTFESLDAPVRRRFGGTQIVAHVIEPQTPDEVKYDIFNRVNTGGSPLEPQEIRHCMSKAPSRNLLKALVSSRPFDQATRYLFWKKSPDGTSVRDNRRMADRELALRFCAFRNTSIKEYESANSLDAFLLDFTRRIDRSFNENELANLRDAFLRSMENCASILGEAAFRRWPLSATRRGPINRAVFESQALALADYSLAELLPHKDQIVAAFRLLFDDIRYDSAVRFGTGDARKVELRLAATAEVVARFVK